MLSFNQPFSAAMSSFASLSPLISFNQAVTLVLFHFVELGECLILADRVPPPSRKGGQ